MSTEKIVGRPAPTAKIFGHVLSTDGAMLQAAKIACNKMETRSLADGFFAIEGLAPGTYEVSASLESFKTATKTVSVQEEVTLNFSLPKAIGTAKIHGHVFDAESRENVKQGGTVTLVVPVANKYAHLDSDGYYQFENLPGGKYRISTSTPGYIDNIVTVKLGDGEIKLHNFLCKTILEEPPWG